MGSIVRLRPCGALDCLDVRHSRIYSEKNRKIAEDVHDCDNDDDDGTVADLQTQEMISRH